MAKSKGGGPGRPCPPPDRPPFVRSLARRPTDPLRLGGQLTASTADRHATQLVLLLNELEGRRLTPPRRKCLEEKLDVLIEKLRNQPGVNVRLPSHISKPIRSLPVDVTGLADCSATATITAVSFTCPVRHAGFIEAVGFAFPPGTAAATWFGADTNNIFVTLDGGIILPTQEGTTRSTGSGATGFNGARPLAVRRGGVAATVAGSVFAGGVGDSDLIRINQPIFEGQTVALVVTTGATTAVMDVTCRLKGYYYHQRVATGDRGVLGTIVD